MMTYVTYALVPFCLMGIAGLSMHIWSALRGAGEKSFVPFLWSRQLSFAERPGLFVGDIVFSIWTIGLLARFIYKAALGL